MIIISYLNHISLVKWDQNSITLNIFDLQQPGVTQ
jgi:hypothetical protein